MGEIYLEFKTKEEARLCKLTSKEREAEELPYNPTTSGERIVNKRIIKSLDSKVRVAVISMEGRVIKRIDQLETNLVGKMEHVEKRLDAILDRIDRVLTGQSRAGFAPEDDNTTGPCISIRSGRPDEHSN